MRTVVLILIIILLGPILALAQEKTWELLINECGEVCDPQTGIKRPQNDQEKMAIANPNRFIPINLKIIEYEKENFFYTIPVKVYSEVMVFSNGKLKITQRTSRIAGERTYSDSLGLSLFIIGVIIILFFSFFGVDFFYCSRYRR